MTKIYFKPPTPPDVLVASALLEGTPLVVDKGTRRRESGDVSKRAALDPSGTIRLVDKEVTDDLPW